MTNSKPIIIQFDSEYYYRSVADLILFKADLSVTYFAYNWKMANALISNIAMSKIPVTLAIIDTILEHNNDEGAEIAAKVRAAAPGVKIMAYTIDDEPVTWADYVAIKSNLNPNQTLLKGLNQLLELNLGDTGKGVDLT